MRSAILLAALLAAVSGAILASPAGAQDVADDLDLGPTLAPDPRAADVRTPVAGDALISVSSALMTFRTGMELHEAPGIAPPLTLRWRGGIGLDDPMRSIARADDAGQRSASAVSDTLLYTTVAYSAAIDAALVPMVQGDYDLVWQAQTALWLALGITQSLGEVVKRAAARDRPFMSECENDPEAYGCDSYDRSRSFFSMHSSTAFTAAGFSCALHVERDVYGDGVADAMSCASSLALATTTAALRIVADRHYLSDVLVGGALGFAVGYLTTIAVVPARGGDVHETGGGATLALTPMLSPSALTGLSPNAEGVIGLSAFGTF
jgi:hypothetical protein